MKQFQRILLIILIFMCNISYAQLSEQKASEIIRYSNSVIKLTNEYIGILDSYRSHIKSYKENRESHRNEPLVVLRIACSGRLVKEDDNIKAAKTPPDAYSEVSRNKLKEDVVAFIDNINILINSCSELHSYLVDNDYKKDNVKQGDELIANMIEKLDLLYQLHYSITSIIKEKNHEAGNIFIVKTDIGKKFILHMKHDLYVSEKILDKVSSISSDNYELFINELSEYKKSVTVNSVKENKDFTILKDPYYKEVYEDFYRKHKYMISYIEKLIERIKRNEKNEIEKYVSSDIRRIFSEYNDIVKKYNTFIKQ